MRKWTEYIRRLIREQPAVGAYSRWALRVGGRTACSLLLLSGIIEWIYPYTGNYLTAMAYQRAALENVPAVLLAGVVAAAVGDLVSLYASK